MGPGHEGDLTPESKGTGKWRELGFPHAGWTCEGITDLRDERVICGMCEVAEIRFVHRMSHPQAGELECGCICAGWMESDSERAVRRERRARNIAARRANWLQRKWRISANGNRFLNTDGFNVVVFFSRGTGYWAGCITNRTTAKAYYSKKFHGTSVDAALGCFEALIFLLDRRSGKTIE